MEKVQFNDGEVRFVTSRHAMQLIAKGRAVLHKEEKKEVETKEEKKVNKTKVKK
jgi:hypothetical protein